MSSLILNDLALLNAANCESQARAAILDASGDYVRLRLAERLLRAAIDDFRQKSTGEMLQRSSAIFSSLTLQSFRALQLDFDSDGKVILVGLRQDGKPVRIEGMSDGTRDQLYLALRIASLELHFKKNPPVPLIADDILVHFDDSRATAALQSLAELARHTQVMLFTHHRHVVDLAQNHLATDQFVTYRLQTSSTVA